MNTNNSSDVSVEKKITDSQKPSKFKAFWKSRFGTLLLLTIFWFGALYFVILGKYTDYYFGEAYLSTRLDWFCTSVFVIMAVLFVGIIIWFILSFFKFGKKEHQRQVMLLGYGGIYVVTFMLLATQVLLAVTFANQLFENQINPNITSSDLQNAFQNGGLSGVLSYLGTFSYLISVDNLKTFNYTFSIFWIVGSVAVFLITAIYYFGKKTLSTRRYLHTVNAALISAFVAMTFSYQGLMGLGTFGLNTRNITFIDFENIGPFVNNFLNSQGVLDAINNIVPVVTVKSIFIDFGSSFAAKSGWLGANNNYPGYLLLGLLVLSIIALFSFWIYNMFFKSEEKIENEGKGTHFIFVLFIYLILINLIFFYSLDKFIMFPITKENISGTSLISGIDISGAINIDVTISINVDVVGVNPGLFNGGIPMLVSNAYKTNAYYLTMFLLNPIVISSFLIFMIRKNKNLLNIKNLNY